MSGFKPWKHKFVWFNTCVIRYAGASKSANDITFGSGQTTVIKIFEFNQNEILKETKYNVEVVYGDDYSKRGSAVDN